MAVVIITAAMKEVRRRIQINGPYSDEAQEETAGYLQHGTRI